MGIHSRETSRDFRVGRNCTLYRCALFEIIDDEIDKEIQGNNIAGKQTARERFIFTKTAICYPLVSAESLDERILLCLTVLLFRSAVPG
jgi:hypothetical protein